MTPHDAGSANLTHHFLIAMPEMADPVFAGTVTYILQHDDQGAIGLIVNRELDVDLKEVFDSTGIEIKDEEARSAPVFHGGPVSHEQGFILHRRGEQQWDASLNNSQWSITSSKDLLEAIAEGDGPAEYLFCLGYSGWSAGQLEEELKQNAWLTVEAEGDIVFSPEISKKYEKALKKLGIDLSNLSSGGGHA